MLAARCPRAADGAGPPREEETDVAGDTPGAAKPAVEHPVDSETERASVVQSGVEPWAGGEKELFVRVIPTRITGRRIRRTAPPATG
jgi:hypothetical protein